MPGLPVPSAMTLPAPRPALAPLDTWSDPAARSRFWAAVATALLLPILHPVLRGLVGVPSHLLWFSHVLPVSMVAYRYGSRYGLGIAIASIAMVGTGEQMFGGGYGTPADTATILALMVAVGFTQLLVGGFAVRVGDEQGRRLAAEAAIQESRRLEAVGRLAGGIGHDVNNVLAVILGSAGVLQSRIAEGDPMHVELRAIEDAVRSAARLVRRLLAFGRLAESVPVCVNLSVALRQMEPMLQRAAGQKVALHWTLASEVGCVRLDMGHLEQVALNLVVNARDAMLSGGTLAISTMITRKPDGFGEAAIGAGTYVMLAVTDTGVGMDERTQKRIFEPYFTTKGEGKGTGLGLATVFGIVRQAKGGISVASRLGEGTTFRIFLPVHEHPLESSTLDAA